MLRLQGDEMTEFVLLCATAYQKQVSIKLYALQTPKSDRRKAYLGKIPARLSTHINFAPTHSLLKLLKYHWLEGLCRMLVAKPSNSLLVSRHPQMGPGAWSETTVADVLQDASVVTLFMKHFGRFNAWWMWLSKRLTWLSADVTLQA